MPRRPAAILALLILASLPAHAEGAEPFGLLCRADNPALQAEPLAFSIDLATNQAVETGSGTRYGVTAYRDGLGLWEAAAGLGQVVYRIDRVKGRFARVDRQPRVEGACEKVERKP